MNARAMMTLQQAQAWINPARLVGDATVAISRVHTDTRTLEPGDLIATGTPPGAGGRFDPPKWLKPGDIVEVESPEIGLLRNRVEDEKA